MNNLITFFNVKGLMPHGYCLIWNPLLLATHVFSDMLIFISYLAIPSIILYVKNKRNDTGFNNLYTMFFLFILLCGVTHIVSVLVLWYPAYGLEGILKFATGIVSIVAALILLKEKNKLIKLESPTQLEVRNNELSCLTEKLKSLNLGLEKEVEKRVHEFKKVNEELLAFSYIISHDFREPLRSIRQFSEIINGDYKDELSKDVQDYMDIIHTSAVQSTELLDSLTRFAKIGTDADTGDICSISDIVNKIIGEFHHSIKSRGINFDISKNLPSFRGNFSHLYEILRNLIENSIKYSDDTKKEKRVSIYYKDSEESLYIEDNGIGIPESKINECINLFYKLNPKTNGLGMGLAICKKLCLVNNIDFSIRTNSMNGVTVSLEFENYLIKNYDL